jgi:DNA-binding CsgD family transcriptional regulator
MTSARQGSISRCSCAASNALDLWNEGVLLLDGRGCVRGANHAGEALLRSADGLSLEGDGHGLLHASTPTATSALRRLVAAAAAVALSACEGTDAPLPRGVLAMTLARPSGRHALAALVVPLHRARVASDVQRGPVAADANRAMVAVFVCDPTHGAGDDGPAVADRLRAVYRLTVTEASVAVALASGDGLQAVAAAHNVTLATVRTQAQRIFRKTGTRGQTALARLVERLAQVR